MQINHCLQDLPQRVSNDDNLKYMAEFTEKEIKEALFSMNLLGAPRYDGFPAQFY